METYQSTLSVGAAVYLALTGRAFVMFDVWTSCSTSKLASVGSLLRIVLRRAKLWS